MSSRVPGSVFDPEARYAALNERVDAFGSRLQSIESSTTAGFRQMDSSIAALSAELRSGQKPQWAAIGVMTTIIIAFIGMAGTLTYGQLKTDFSEFRSFAAPRESLEAFRSTYDSNRKLFRDDYLADRAETKADIKAIREEMRTDRVNVVTRAEHLQRWDADKNQNTNLQRQIDEITREVSGIYSARDVIKDLQDRIDRLDREGVKP